MAEIKLPFIKLRPKDGTFRPRFSPGARERDLGFKDEDLKHDDGRWYSLEEAKIWSQAKHAAILDQRKIGKRLKQPATKKRNTLEALLDDFLADFKRRVARGERSQASLDSYVKAARAVVYLPETRGEAKERRQREAAAALLNVNVDVDRQREPLATSLVAAIGAPELRAFYEYALEARGHHMALQLISVISAAFTWGRESVTWRLGPNPRHEMEFDRPAGRIEFYSLEEFFAIVAAADELEYWSVGDAYYLGLFTGQRQTDRLAMHDLGMIDGRRHLLQSKTGTLVKLKDTPQLAERLASARARVAAIKLKLGTRPEEIVVDETTGLAYNDTTYRHRVAEARDLAAQRVPSIARLTDRDLRDTFVTLTYRAMVRAGRVDMKAIADVSGHSYSSIETIIKHYLGKDPAAADAALDLLADFVAREGVG